MSRLLKLTQYIKKCTRHNLLIRICCGQNILYCSRNLRSRKFMYSCSPLAAQKRNTWKKHFLRKYGNMYFLRNNSIVNCFLVFLNVYWVWLSKFWDSGIFCTLSTLLKTFFSTLLELKEKHFLININLINR